MARRSGCCIAQLDLGATRRPAGVAPMTSASPLACCEHTAAIRHDDVSSHRGERTSNAGWGTVHGTKVRRETLRVLQAGCDAYRRAGAMYVRSYHGSDPDCPYARRLPAPQGDVLGRVNLSARDQHALRTRLNTTSAPSRLACRRLVGLPARHSDQPRRANKIPAVGV